MRALSQAKEWAEKKENGSYLPPKPINNAEALQLTFPCAES